MQNNNKNGSLLFDDRHLTRVPVNNSPNMNNSNSTITSNLTHHSLLNQHLHKMQQPQISLPMRAMNKNMPTVINIPCVRILIPTTTINGVIQYQPAHIPLSSLNQFSQFSQLSTVPFQNFQTISNNFQKLHNLNLPTLQALATISTLANLPLPPNISHLINDIQSKPFSNPMINPMINECKKVLYPKIQSNVQTPNHPILAPEADEDVCETEDETEEILLETITVANLNPQAKVFDPITIVPGAVPYTTGTMGENNNACSFAKLETISEEHELNSNEGSGEAGEEIGESLILTIVDDEDSKRSELQQMKSTIINGEIDINDDLDELLPILNKINAYNYQLLSKKVKNMITEKNRIYILQKIMEIAINENITGMQYAKLCKFFPNYLILSNCEILFRMICNNKTIKNEEYFATLKWFACLYVVGVIKKSIIHNGILVPLLMKYKEQIPLMRDIEGVCELLKIIGNKMQKRNPLSINIYFNYLKTLKNKYDIRIQLMIENLIKMRDENWIKMNHKNKNVPEISKNVSQQFTNVSQHNITTNVSQHINTTNVSQHINNITTNVIVNNINTNISVNTFKSNKTKKQNVSKNENVSKKYRIPFNAHYNNYNDQYNGYDHNGYNQRNAQRYDNNQRNAQRYDNQRNAQRYDNQRDAQRYDNDQYNDQRYNDRYYYYNMNNDNSNRYKSHHSRRSNYQRYRPQNSRDRGRGRGRNNNRNNTVSRKVSAEFVCDVTLPDRGEHGVNKMLIKTWRMKNNGNIEWGNDVELVFFKGQEEMITSRRIPIGNCMPNETIDININVCTPGVPGRYCAYYRLQKAGKFFGPRVWVDLISVISENE